MKRKRLTAYRMVALAVAALTVGGMQVAGAGTAAHQPEPDLATEEGTATGAFRPGLTRAGLVDVTELDDASVWLGLTDRRDRGARLDVRVELLNNGVPVASGLQRCVGKLHGPLPGRGHRHGRRDAREVTVPWDAFEPETLDVGDVLSLRVSTRIGTTDDGSRCGGRRSASGLRLHYDSIDRPSGFGLTITPDPSANVYLHSDATTCDGADLALSEAEPTDPTARCQDSGSVGFSGGNPWSEVGAWDLPAQCDCANELVPEVRDHPPAPEPENVVLERLPLPPPPTDGVCDVTVNVQGCVTEPGSMGSFVDNETAVGVVAFGGAPDSIFSGNQLIAVKADGGTFENGTPWKCLSCGMPAENQQGVAPLGATGQYPQPFNDGHRVLVGTTILECAEPLTSDECTPENTFRYPIRWNTSPDGSGSGGSMRELRIHPDGVHLGWSSLALGGTKLDQFMYYGRLEFNSAPATGEPGVPRYDLINVNLMYDPEEVGPVWPDPDNPGELRLDPLLPEVGEFRRWSKDGQWAAYVGAPSRSNRIDIFKVHLETGEVRQLTRHPEYTDPMDLSYDGEWAVYLDTRGSDRQMFMSGIPGIPALTDLITSGFVSSVRNDGQRRFFQPILIDIHGDRGDYEGQALKDSCPGGPAPGNLCDPDWNARADPHFSPDGTAIVYRETNHGVGVPDAETSRNVRWVIARLVDREPQPYTPPDPAPDVIPWATPYTPGDPEPFRASLLPPEGTYTLQGAVFGSAEVTIEHDTDSGPTPVMGEVAVSYDNFSLDGINVINGTERAIRLPYPQSTPTAPALEWHSDLTLTGCQEGTKVTIGPDGNPGPFRARIDLFQTILFSEGDLVTTIDGVSYVKPPMGPNHRPF